MWLRDFISTDEDLVGCRVMIFGYDTKYRSEKEKWIEDHVNDFLAELDKARQTKQERTRPLVMLGHSFGGTIVAHNNQTQAYVQASDNSDYQNIYHSTKDIFFFGVPFRSIDLNDVRSMAEDICGLEHGQGEKLVDYIIYETQRVTQTIGTFKKRIFTQKTKIFSFFETAKIKRLVKQDNGSYNRTGEPYIVVNKNSVELGISELEKVIETDGNHSTIVKFDGNHDKTYTTVRRYLHNTISGKTRRYYLTDNGWDDSDEDLSALQKLQTTDPRDDKSRIEDTKGGLLKDSYKWILGNPDFRRWREEDEYNLLWISGDPGKGKTMLLCGIIDELESSSTSTFYLSYFFCQATDPRINSATAVLRGLIYLLIHQQPTLLSHLQKRYRQTGEGLFEPTNLWYKLPGILTDILRDLVTAGGGNNTIHLVIDALDECVSDLKQLLDFISKNMSVSPRIKWIVSSRNRYSVENQLTFPTKIGSRLSLEVNANLVSQAVGIFIKDRILRLWPNEHEDFRKRVQNKLTEKAGGTFLWVALALKDLQERKIIHRRIDLILRKVEEMPGSLSGLYGQMLAQLDGLDSEDSKLCRIILSTVSLAYRPLQLAELQSLTELENESKTGLDILNNLVKECGSFLTIRNSTIYFIHQSAIDFLIGDGSSIIFGSTSRKEVHYSIFLHSISTMSNILRRNIYNLQRPMCKIGDFRPPDSDPLETIQYSCTHWVDHFHEGITIDDLFLDNDRCQGVLDFLENHFLHWLEALSLIGAVPESMKIAELLLPILGRSQEASAKNLHLFVSDAKRFIIMHQSIFVRYPLQLYTSCLLCSPRQSVVRKQNWSQVTHFIKNASAIQEHWSPHLQELRVPGDTIYLTAFSPDGKLLASSCTETTLLWNIPIGILRARIDCTYREDSKLSFSHDSKFLAIWRSRSGTGLEWERYISVDLWDTATGEHYAWANTNFATSVLFSHDSGTLAVLTCESENCEYRNTVEIFKINKGAMNLEFKINLSEGGPETKYIGRSVSFASDGRLLILCPSDSDIQIWNLITRALHARLSIDASGSCYPTFSPNGRIFAYISGELRQGRVIKLRNTSTGGVLGSGFQLPKGHADGYNRIWFSRDSTFLASCTKFDAKGSVSFLITIWNIATGVLHTQLRFAGERTLLTVCFLPDNRFLAVFVPAKHMRPFHSTCIEVWDIGAVKSNARYPNLIGAPRFSPNSESLALVSPGGCIKLYDITKAVADAEFEPMDGLINQPPLSGPPMAVYHNNLKHSTMGNGNSVVSPDRALLAFYSETEHEDNKIKLDISLWNTASDILHLRLNLCTRTRSQLRYRFGILSSWILFSPNSKLLAVAYHGIVQIWDTHNGVLRCVLQDLHDGCNTDQYQYETNINFKLQFSPNSTRLMTCCTSCSQTIKIWDIETRTLQIQWKGPEVCPDSLLTGKPIHFSRDGKFLAWLCMYAFRNQIDGFKEAIVLWDTVTGSTRVILPYGSEIIDKFEISPNSKILAALTQQQQQEQQVSRIRVWDIATATGVLQLKFKDTNYFQSISFSSDGWSLAALSPDSNIIKFWDIPSRGVILNAAQKVSKQLEPKKEHILKSTQGEWGALDAIILPPDFEAHTAQFYGNDFEIVLKSGKILCLQTSANSPAVGIIPEPGSGTAEKSTDYEPSATEGASTNRPAKVSKAGRLSNISNAKRRFELAKLDTPSKVQRLTCFPGK
ncbi:hypothetical protein TWF730_008042 [Orbilia blumenaviensis]|uniref:NACHT domain-containing protein n=1 Tax=Orbilia blumenaviensis TaxID=1796055 RepID=A0AAV9VA50_9PEZI